MPRKVWTQIEVPQRWTQLIRVFALSPRNGRRRGAVSQPLKCVHHKFLSSTGRGVPACGTTARGAARSCCGSHRRFQRPRGDDAPGISEVSQACNSASSRWVQQFVAAVANPAVPAPPPDWAAELQRLGTTAARAEPTRSAGLCRGVPGSLVEGRCFAAGTRRPHCSKRIFCA